MVTSCAMTRHPPPCANRWSRLQAAPVSAEAPGTIDAIRPDAAPTALSHSASAQTGLTAHVVVRAIANVADTAISNKSVRRPSGDYSAIADDDRMLRWYIDKQCTLIARSVKCTFAGDSCYLDC